MGEDEPPFDVHYASFRQQFANGPQRRKLGYDIAHTAAQEILNDPVKLVDEYARWRATSGKPPCEEQAPTPRASSWWDRIRNRGA